MCYLHVWERQGGGGEEPTSVLCIHNIKMAVHSSVIICHVVVE